MNDCKSNYRTNKKARNSLNKRANCTNRYENSSEQSECKNL